MSEQNLPSTLPMSDVRTALRPPQKKLPARIDRAVRRWGTNLDLFRFSSLSLSLSLNEARPRRPLWPRCIGRGGIVSVCELDLL